jgi:hypothetical protein
MGLPCGAVDAQRTLFAVDHDPSPEPTVSMSADAEKAGSVCRARLSLVLAVLAIGGQSQIDDSVVASDAVDVV